MQVTQEKRPGSRIGFTIDIPADHVKRSYDKTVREISRNAQIEGFRKGKAPLQMVMHYIGRERIRFSALEDLLENSIQDAIKQAAIKPLTTFEIDGGVEELVKQYSPEAGLVIIGSVEVMPEVKLNAYKDLTVTVQRVDADPAQVDQILNRWREQRATLIPVEGRPAQLGDVATVDFTATKADGSPLEGASARDYQLDMKEDTFYPGFVTGMVGMEVDEARDIDLTLPEDYFDPSLAGQAVKFRVLLNDLKSRELPELDNQLVQEISDFTTVEELRQSLLQRLEKEAIQKSRTNLDNSLLDTIAEQAELELPNSIVEREITDMISQSLAYLNSQAGYESNELLEATKQNWGELSERVRPEALQRLRRTFALSEVVALENISVGRTELEVALEDYVTQYHEQGGTEKLDPRRLQEMVLETLMTRKVLAWLRTQNGVNWVDAEGNPVDPPQLESPEDEVPPELTGELVPEAEFEGDGLEGEVIAATPAGEETLEEETLEAVAISEDLADAPDPEPSSEPEA